MASNTELQALVSRFEKNLAHYKNAQSRYNEHSCRVEYIDPLLRLLGWDVSNASGQPPQYREVIAENYQASAADSQDSSTGDKPDYSLTIRGVTKFFVEAKKPAVNVFSSPAPAFQARKYGWNAKHKIAVLTNFEYLVIYDTTCVPRGGDNSSVARYRVYHCSEYVAKWEEIASLLSREAVYSGAHDQFFDARFPGDGNQKQQVDHLFLAQINRWRIALSNELYRQDEKYRSLEYLSDVVQEFINQIVFLRICEDKNLPLYHKLKDTIRKPADLHKELEKLFRKADKLYNSGMFSGRSIVFDLNSETITEIIQGLYYPQSPYLFNIIEPNMLGKIYEMFLTEQLVVLGTGSIGLEKKKECIDRSIVTTPTEIVRYMVEKTLTPLCEGKTPGELHSLRIADIACGSGVYLEEVFAFLHAYCVEWYLENEPGHLSEIGAGRYKLPLEEKKSLLCACVFGVDQDVHAVEVAKFSLLVKLIEDETPASVTGIAPILPDLSANVFHGNALVGRHELRTVEMPLEPEQLEALVPFDWENGSKTGQFDAIIGNPPYASTEEMHKLLSPVEFHIYQAGYRSAYKQFDKYFLFLERAIQQVKDGGYVCYIVPNKFFKIPSGKKLRGLIAGGKYLVSLDDFGATQLFDDKTTYSSIVFLQKNEHPAFEYATVGSVNTLWLGEMKPISQDASSLGELPWRLTMDTEILSLLQNLESRAVPMKTHAEIFNGIQTSAERPVPIYWFSQDDLCGETDTNCLITRDGRRYSIEKAILRPFFKPTSKNEKGLNTYSILSTDKRIIFPYDAEGRLYPVATMKKHFPGAYKYLKAHYARLLPKNVSPDGVRDVPNATAQTWYQYGRTQALTAFINTPKLIVGVLSREPMYVFDDRDMLIASGGTAGYCAISAKAGSPYALEYIQAWLTNPYTERIIRVTGSNFEGDFISRGTFVLSNLPFVELDFSDAGQKKIYDRVVGATREIYRINGELAACPPKRRETTLLRQKEALIAEIEGLILRVYKFDF